MYQVMYQVMDQLMYPGTHQHAHPVNLVDHPTAMMNSLHMIKSSIHVRASEKQTTRHYDQVASKGCLCIYYGPAGNDT